VGERGGGLRVLIAGGGTGGHLYPGIAVARELMARHADTIVTFAGTALGIEARVLPRERLPLDTIRSAGLKGKSLAARVRGTALLPLSALDAWRVVSRRAPHVVVGVGGYSSGPVVAMAALQRRRTLVLEQNAMPGLANRWLARVVDAAAVAYDEALPWFPRGAFVSGNPVRAGFLAAAGQRAPVRDAGETRRLLVFGGSQGARAINDAMVEAAGRLAAADPPVELTHQTGERDVDRVRAAYASAGLRARVEPFLHEMEQDMAWADLVVSRAGATTLAELTAAGKAALLIPLPTATDDHQRRNAEALVRRGAADVLEQSALSGASLAARILGLLSDGARLDRMREAARAASRPEAARVIAEAIERLAEGR
jgi:UDP-N-acetylglucosamine--N-acetylmuramyl-(pentapeptide) pyrophosphoryl-undecaprenol N-acetylglucosamine transferase